MNIQANLYSFLSLIAFSISFLNLKGEAEKNQFEIYWIIFWNINITFLLTLILLN